MVKRIIPGNMSPWECEINDVKYVYPPGTEQMVPDEVAHVIDAWYAAQEQESVPGGGGGMLVTVTLNDDDTFTPDKTFQEAINAVAAGVDVRFVIQQEGSGNRTFLSLIHANIGDELIEDPEIWLFSNWSGEQYWWTASRFVIHGGSE